MTNKVIHTKEMYMIIAIPSPKKIFIQQTLLVHVHRLVFNDHFHPKSLNIVPLIYINNWFTSHEHIETLFKAN